MGARTGSVGISAIAAYEPPWVLENAWLGDSLPRKFVRHTGIRSRRISQEDEQESAIRAEYIQYVVPHQAGTGIVRLTSMKLLAAGIHPDDWEAGTGIVRLTSMKLAEIGVRGDVIDGMTTEVGNVSSSSIQSPPGANSESPSPCRPANRPAEEGHETRLGRFLHVVVQHDRVVGPTGDVFKRLAALLLVDKRAFHVGVVREDRAERRHGVALMGWFL